MPRPIRPAQTRLLTGAHQADNGTARVAPSGPTVRTEALSDAVFAIAMTLLVLDLHTPDGKGGSLLHGLLAQWPSYVGFFASFLFIGVIWTNHHSTFRRIDSCDRSVMWANLAILGGTVLLPFSTAVLASAFRGGNHADEQAAAILYAGVAILLTSPWLFLFGLLHRRSTPTDGAFAPWRAQMRRPILGSLGYACGAAISLIINPAASLVAFLLVPIYYALTSEGLEGTNRERVSVPRLT